MRFFGTPYNGSMSYRETSRISRQDLNEQPPTTQHTTPQKTRGVPMEEDALLLEIQRLSFVEVELRLYLDGYPECQSALRNYRETVAKLKEATDEYEMKYGPLTATNTRGDYWLWVKGKWPWQTEEWR